MKIVELEGFRIKLSVDGKNVLVKMNEHVIILVNQNIDAVSDLLIKNFYSVKEHYKLIVDSAEEHINYKDIDNISIEIVLYYLYMYNSWRIIYKKHEDRDLRFIVKDFDNPSTHDIIINFFKSKYQVNWEIKCAILLGIDINEFHKYYNARLDYYNK